MKRAALVLILALAGCGLTNSSGHHPTTTTRVPTTATQTPWQDSDLVGTWTSEAFAGATDGKPFTMTYTMTLDADGTLRIAVVYSSQHSNLDCGGTWTAKTVWTLSVPGCEGLGQSTAAGWDWQSTATPLSASVLAVDGSLHSTFHRD